MILHVNDDSLAEPVEATLGQLNPRRFEILLACIRLGGLRAVSAT